MNTLESPVHQSASFYEVYEKLDALGSGNFAEVRRARKLSDQDSPEVAVKIIQKLAFNEPQHLEM